MKRFQTIYSETGLGRRGAVSRSAGL